MQDGGVVTVAMISRDACKTSIYLPRLNYSVKHVLSEVRVTPSNILKQLQSLDVNKASLGLTSKLLQACASEISPSLCRLFNLSLELGTFPEKWKDANLVPNHKGESKSMVSNYPGISLLDILSKILERQFYNEIFYIICPRLTHWQLGFLPGKSTVSQLSQVVHHFAVALKRRQQVDVIYLNFSKAFDRVSHEKLLFKHECLGIGGSLFAWFRSYLSGRRHRVVIDNGALIGGYRCRPSEFQTLSRRHFGTFRCRRLNFINFMLEVLKRRDVSRS